MAIKFLTGDSYPHLCPVCRAAIDSMAAAYGEGLMEDTDDNEAPANAVYDNALYCGGRECVNKPDIQWTRGPEGETAEHNGCQLRVGFKLDNGRFPYLVWKTGDVNQSRGEAKTVTEAKANAISLAEKK